MEKNESQMTILKKYNIWNTKETICLINFWMIIDRFYLALKRVILCFDDWNVSMECLWRSKWMYNNWVIRVFQKKNKKNIFCCALFFGAIFWSCHINICCFSCCKVSRRLVAFFVSKKLLEFVRKVVKSTFASGDQSTSWFSLIPNRHD